MKNILPVAQNGAIVRPEDQIIQIEIIILPIHLKASFHENHKNARLRRDDGAWLKNMTTTNIQEHDTI